MIRTMYYQKGFTLIELMVAITVMATLSSVGIASFVSYSRSQALSSAMQDFVTALQSAKANTASQVKPSTCIGTFQGYRIAITTSSEESSYSMGPLCSGIFDTASSKTTVLPKSNNVSFGSDLTITFEPITGVVTFDPVVVTDYKDVILTGSEGMIRTVRIYSDGRINVLP